MTKKITIEVSEQVHKVLLEKQEEKKKALKAKVPLAVIVSEVLEEVLITVKK